LKKKSFFTRVEDFYDRFFRGTPVWFRFVVGLPIIVMAFLFFGVGAIIEAITEATDKFLDGIVWKVVSYQYKRQRKREKHLKPLNFVPLEREKNRSFIFGV